MALDVYFKEGVANILLGNFEAATICLPASLDALDETDTAVYNALEALTRANLRSFGIEWPKSDNTDCET